MSKTCGTISPKRWRDDSSTQMTMLGARVRIVPGNSAVYEADLAGDLAKLANLLGVSPIEEWPPTGGEHDADAVAHFRDAQLSDPSVAGWLVYYVCCAGDAENAAARGVLVGSAGFFGPPSDGVAEIGYSICLAYRQRGLATKTVAMLIELARRNGVHTLTATTRADNAASAGVLMNNGFIVDPQRSASPDIAFSVDIR